MTRLVTRPGLLALVLGAVTCAYPRGARALGEEEWSATLALGGTLLGAPDNTARALGAGLEVARGLTDVFAVRGAVAADGLDWGKGPAWSAGYAFFVSAGGVASLDVLRVVPLLELSLVAAYFGEGLESRLGGELGMGAEYLLDRNLTLGAGIRGRNLPLSFKGATAWVPSGTALLRLGWRFD